MSLDLVIVVQARSYGLCLVILVLAISAEPSQNFNLEKFQVPNSNQHNSSKVLVRKDIGQQGALADNVLSPKLKLVEENGESMKNNSSAHKNSPEVKVEEILRQIFEAEFDEEEEDELEGEEEAQNDAVEVHRKAGDATPFVLLTPNENMSADLAQNETRNGRAKRYPINRRRKPQNQQHVNKNERKTNQKTGNSETSNREGSGKHNRRPNRKNSPQSLQQKRKGVDLAKFNAYMDAVLGRMNSLIRKKRMDPLRVNLYSGPGPNQRNKNKNVGGGKKKTKKKSSARLEDEDEESSEYKSAASASAEEDDDESEEDREDDEDARSVRDVTLVNSQLLQRKYKAISENSTLSIAERDSKKSTESEVEGDADQGRGKLNNGKQKKDQKVVENSDTGSSKTDDETQQRRKVTPKRNSPRPTRGILHGLSSLRRDGNVQIIKDGKKARVIRSRFLLGPVALEILPKKTGKRPYNSRGDDQDTLASSSRSPAATATAPQLKGIIEIRLSPGKPTRIRKLRVFPPGNLQVNGDKKSGGSPAARGAGYRKVTPMATARLRQAAVQVVKQVDSRMKSKAKLH